MQYTMDTKGAVMETYLEEIEQRRWLFHADFGGEEFIEHSLIEATERLCKVAGIIYGQKAANGAFDKLVADPFPSAVAEFGWRGALEEEANGLYSDTPGGGLLHDLTAYADYGLVLSPCRTLEERKQILGEQVQDGLLLLDLVVSQLEDKAGSPVWRIVKKSLARWKLDTGKALDKAELSLLSGLADQSIRNRLSGKSREINGTIERVEAAEALKWLTLQRKFVSSLWRYQDDTEAVRSTDKAVAEPLFLPVAQDNSLFHPGLQKDDVYTVGGVGHEQTFKRFDDALAALQEMTVPTWRRPSEDGRWMQVKGMNWRRVDRAELAFQIDMPNTLADK
jgi:hypothetical protein